MVALLLCYSVHSSHHRVPYIYIHIGGGRWDFRFFGFCHFFCVNFGFSVLLSVAVSGFSVFSTWFSVFGKNKAVFGFWWPMCFFGFSNLEGSQRQTCTGSQCGFCGSAALSTTLKLHFCSYKHFFQRFTSFVAYDRRSFKNCFQRRPIFLDSSLCHQCLFKILYRLVICCNGRQ